MKTTGSWKTGCALMYLAFGVALIGCGKKEDTGAQTDPVAGINSLPPSSSAADPTNPGNTTGTTVAGGAGNAQPGGNGAQPGTTNPQTTLPANVAQLPSCTQCPNSHCVPGNLVPAAQQGLLARCQDQGSFCVPDTLLQNPGGFVLPTCRSLGNMEGRCVSTCLPLVAGEINRLPQGSCKSDERCAPCYHPLTGEDTQVCRQGGDAGPQEAARTFPECCQGGSLCVPATLVPQAQRSFLQQAECPSADQLCAPKDLARSDYKPPKCKSIGDANGRCLSVCIPGLSSLGSVLPQSSCPARTLCVPCVEPITNTDTGACRINGDTP